MSMPGLPGAIKGTDPLDVVLSALIASQRGEAVLVFHMLRTTGNEFEQQCIGQGLRVVRHLPGAGAVNSRIVRAGDEFDVLIVPTFHCTGWTAPERVTEVYHLDYASGAAIAQMHARLTKNRLGGMES